MDDRGFDPAALAHPLVLTGGSITIDALSAELGTGGVLDVSGGVAVGAQGAVSYGAGGSIAIRTGSDPGFSTVLGGALKLGATLSGYSGGKGGSLALQTGVIQVGGAALTPAALVVSPDFSARAASPATR